MKKTESPQEWLAFAESDWELARIGKVSKKIKYETLCFHAQQAAEKAIKAVLVYNNRTFPKTHNIKLILDLLAVSGIDVPPLIKTADQLTDYATEIRYPGLYTPVDRKEYIESLKIASKVLKWAKIIIEKKNGKLF